MAETKRKVRNQDAALSRAQIVAAADLLDREDEAVLTFKVLAAELATEAIYGHIASKSDLMAASADAIDADVQLSRAGNAVSQDSIRVFALGMFDAIDAYL